jgi:hypothetical protein
VRADAAISKWEKRKQFEREKESNLRERKRGSILHTVYKTKSSNFWTWSKSSSVFSSRLNISKNSRFQSWVYPLVLLSHMQGSEADEEGSKEEEKASDVEEEEKEEAEDAEAEKGLLTVGAGVWEWWGVEEGKEEEEEGGIKGEWCVDVKPFSDAPWENLEVKGARAGGGLDGREREEGAVEREGEGEGVGTREGCGVSSSLDASELSYPSENEFFIFFASASSSSSSSLR